MNIVNIQDATVSSWISEINIYRYGNLKYWIHKIPITDNYVMTNFNYDLTNIDLKTTDLKVAEERSAVIMRSKTNVLMSAISTLTTFTKSIRRKSIQLTPDVNRSLIDFTSKIKQFNNV